MPKRLTISYYPWITQRISGPKLEKAIQAFVALLQTELGKDYQLELLKEMEVPEQIADMQKAPENGIAGKIGLLNPIGYALAHKKTPAVQAIAVIRRKIGTDPAGPTYKAQLYTNWKTPIKTIDDMRGRSIAFGSPQSTSNFLVPAVMLHRAKIHPLNGFTRVEFTGGHDKAAVAVYEGRLDIGAGHDGVIIDLKERRGFGDADKVLVRIDFSQDIPSDPVAIHAADPAVRSKVADALVQVAKASDQKSAGNKAVKEFWGTDEGFEKIDPEKYAVLLGVMDELMLRPDDMLRRP